MSTQSKTMPKLDIKMYVRVVAAVFSISSATAFVFALLRLLNPDLFYLHPLEGNKNIGVHYFISGLMIVTSGIGFLNSCVVLNRSASHNTGRNITTWLLLDSLFETTRIVYLFVCEILLKGKGPMHLYELLISVVQYHGFTFRHVVVCLTRLLNFIYFEETPIGVSSFLQFLLYLISSIFPIGVLFFNCCTGTHTTPSRSLLG